MNIGELDRDTLQAHLSLHNWVPAFGIVSRSNTSTPMNMKMVISEDRWFSVSGECGRFAYQTGPRSNVRKHHETMWAAFSDGELLGLAEAMVSYGELHDPG